MLTAQRGCPGFQGLLAERQRMVHFRRAAQRATRCFATHRARCCSGSRLLVEPPQVRGAGRAMLSAPLPHQQPSNADRSSPQPCCPRGGAVETAGFEERPPNDGPGPAPGTRVPARDRGKSGPKPRSSTPHNTRTDGSAPSPGTWGDVWTQGPGSRHRPGLPETGAAQGRPEPAPGTNPQDPTAIP